MKKSRKRQELLIALLVAHQLKSDSSGIVNGYIQGMALVIRSSLFFFLRTIIINEFRGHAWKDKRIRASCLTHHHPVLSFNIFGIIISISIIDQWSYGSCKLLTGEL